MVTDLQTVDVINGTASFAGSHKIIVDLANPTEGLSKTITLQAEEIFINTGATTIVPDIPGLAECSNIFTSTTILDLEILPKYLVILDGGSIGLEFASMYASFGSKVTVLVASDSIAKKEDPEITVALQTILEKNR